MALDGRGHLLVSYDWPTPKSGEVNYGSQEAAAMEENMVVMFHA